MSRKPFLISSMLVLIMIAVSTWAYLVLPSGPIAVHFGLSGAPNGFVPKIAALVILPMLGALITAVMASLLRSPSLRTRLADSILPYSVNWIGGIFVLTITHGLVIAKALGAPVDMARVVCLSIGLLYVVVGNYYGRIRYNYVFGLRTPWTLNSERVWDKTHRFMGRIMVFSALLLVISVFVVGSEVALALFMAMFIGTPIVLGIIYSAILPPCSGAPRTNVAG